MRITYEETESNFKLFMPEFYSLQDQNNTHSNSSSHTNKIVYSDLQFFMSGFLNMNTLHRAIV